MARQARPARHVRLAWGARIVAAAALAALAVSVGATAAFGEDHTVTTVNNGGDQPYAYEPQTISIAPGDTVTWVNPPGTPLSPSQDHPTVCLQGESDGECPWSSFELPPGESHTVEFPAEGTFNYQCLVHPYMSGTVVVGDGVPNTPEPTSSETASSEPTEEPSQEPTDEPTEDTTNAPSPTPGSTTASGQSPSPSPSASPSTDETSGGAGATGDAGGVPGDEPVDDAPDGTSGNTDGAAGDTSGSADATAGSTSGTDDEGGAEEASDDAAAASSDGGGGILPWLGTVVVLGILGAMAYGLRRGDA